MTSLGQRASTSSRTKPHGVRWLRILLRGQAIGLAPVIKKLIKTMLLVFATSRYTVKMLSLKSLISNTSVNAHLEIREPWSRTLWPTDVLLQMFHLNPVILLQVFQCLNSVQSQIHSHTNVSPSSIGIDLNAT